MNLSGIGYMPQQIPQLQGLYNGPFNQTAGFSLNGGAGGSGGLGSLMGNSGFGMNLPTAQLGLGILSSLGGLWSASNMNKLARDQFNYARKVTDTNLRNQTQSYNTALEDRIRSRMFTEGRPSSEGEAYLDRNRLTR